MRRRAEQVGQAVIGLIGEGTVVFVWYPDPAFLEKSAYLDPEGVEERMAESAGD